MKLYIVEDTSDLCPIFKDHLETIVSKLEGPVLEKEKSRNEQTQLIQELSIRLNNLEQENLKLKEESNLENIPKANAMAKESNPLGKVFHSKLTVFGNSFDKVELITCNKSQGASIGKCKTCLHNLNQFKKAGEHNFVVLEGLKSEILFLKSEQKALSQALTEKKQTIQKYESIIKMAMQMDFRGSLKKPTSSSKSLMIDALRENLTGRTSNNFSKSISKFAVSFKGSNSNNGVTMSAISEFCLESVNNPSENQKSQNENVPSNAENNCTIVNGSQESEFQFSLNQQTAKKRNLLPLLENNLESQKPSQNLKRLTVLSLTKSGKTENFQMSLANHIKRCKDNAQSSQRDFKLKSDKRISIANSTLPLPLPLMQAETNSKRCLRCGKHYRSDENNRLSCKYHRGEKKRIEEFDSSGMRVKIRYIWGCCNMEMGLNDGCTESKHI